MDPLAPLLANLHGTGRLRVWSLVITVFGDAVSPRGGRVAALRLQVLFERLGIEPGTLRTALSRLGQDGWIEREKDGRSAFYRLSARGVKEFAPATQLIYRPPARPEVWTMGTGDPPPGAHATTEAWLFPGRIAGQGMTVTGNLANVPEAARKAFLTETWENELNVLKDDLAAIDPDALDPLSAMAARTVLIHRWRRVVLANADLPDAIRPAHLPGRTEVGETYARLLPASEAWLDDTSLPAIGPVSGDVSLRFRA